MDQQQECVEIVEEILPIALGRVYAEHILPHGYRVSIHNIQRMEVFFTLCGGQDPKCFPGT